MAKTQLMDEHFFSLVVVSNEIGILKALRRAVPKWEELAAQEVKSVEEAPRGGSELEDYWHEQHVNDQYYVLDVTKGALLGGLSVSMASAVERVMIELCRDRGEAMPGRPGWKDARETLDRLTGTNISTLAGFPSANRARLLGNCFKHNGGARNAEFVRTFGGAADEEICYADEDWDAIIDGVQTFLTALGQAVWRGPKPPAT